MRKEKSRSLDSFLVSIILHAVFMVVLASYIIVSDRGPDSIDVSWVNVPEPAITVPRPLLDESLIRKPAPKREVGVTTTVRHDLRSPDITQVIAPSPEIVRKSVEMNPKAVKANILPSVTTETRIGPSDNIPFSFNSSRRSIS